MTAKKKRKKKLFSSIRSNSNDPAEVQRLINKYRKELKVLQSDRNGFVSNTTVPMLQDRIGYLESKLNRINADINSGYGYPTVADDSEHFRSLREEAARQNRIIENVERRYNTPLQEMTRVNYVRNNRDLLTSLIYDESNPIPQNDPIPENETFVSDNETFLSVANTTYTVNNATVYTGTITNTSVPDYSIWTTRFPPASRRTAVFSVSRPEPVTTEVQPEEVEDTAMAGIISQDADKVSTKDAVGSALQSLESYATEGNEAEFTKEEARSIIVALKKLHGYAARSSNNTGAKTVEQLNQDTSLFLLALNEMDMYVMNRNDEEPSVGNIQSAVRVWFQDSGRILP